MSLKLKFSILALFFTGVIAGSLIIQAFSAQENSRKINKLEEQQTREYFLAQEMLNSFRLIDYLFEIAVLTEEQSLFDNAQSEKEKFISLINDLRIIKGKSDQGAGKIEELFESYFRQSMIFSRMMINQDPFSAGSSDELQNQINELSLKTSASRDNLRGMLEHEKSVTRSAFSSTLEEINLKAKDELFQHTLIGISVSFALMFLLFIIYRAIVKPVTYLSEMTEHVSRGEYASVRGEEKRGKGEIDRLLNSFLKMTRNLEKTTVSRDYFNTIIQNSADMVFVLDESLLIEFSNSSTKEILGYSAEELSGLPLRDLVDPVWMRKSSFKEASFDGVFYDHEEIKMILKNGEFLPVMFSCSPLLDAEKKVTSHVCIASDISDRIEAEKALKEAEHEARQKELLQKDRMETLSILVAGVAHEINNPNHVIASNTVFLKKSWESAIKIFQKYYDENGSFSLGGVPYEKAGEYIPQLLDLIQGGSERIKNIVKELRDYARIEPTLITEEVSPNAVVKSASTLMANMIKKSASDFVLELETDLPPVMGNYQKLEQVMINLIANSCQALKGREGTLSIQTTLDLPGGRVGILVEDQGKGMNPEVMKHIFDPFYTTRRDEGGTGLGLSISHSIVNEHDGELKFSSQEGKGTRAEIWLPAIEKSGE